MISNRKVNQMLKLKVEKDIFKKNNNRQINKKKFCRKTDINDAFR